MNEVDAIRNDIYWLRLMIGRWFIYGADQMVLQAATAVLRGREERLRQLEQVEATA
jgi:hypothetical protein